MDIKQQCLLQQACDRRQFRGRAAAVLRWCAPSSTAALRAMPHPATECRWRSPASTHGPYIRFAVTAAPTTVPTAEGVDSISMAQASGGTWTWSCSAHCSSTGSLCSIEAAGLRLLGPLTPLIGRLQCRNQIDWM